MSTPQRVNRYIILTSEEHAALTADNARLTAEVAELRKNQAKSLLTKTAACTVHRACCGCEHDPANGKLHSYCIVCGVPWPCEVAKAFIDAAISKGDRA